MRPPQLPGPSSALPPRQYPHQKSPRAISPVPSKNQPHAATTISLHGMRRISVKRRTLLNRKRTQTLADVSIPSQPSQTLVDSLKPLSRNKKLAHLKAAKQETNANNLNKINRFHRKAPQPKTSVIDCGTAPGTTAPRHRWFRSSEQSRRLLPKNALSS
jgi:hypothetical protein